MFDYDDVLLDDPHPLSGARAEVSSAWSAGSSSNFTFRR
jgi:hypothetical protein